MTHNQKTNHRPGACLPVLTAADLKRYRRAIHLKYGTVMGRRDIKQLNEAVKRIKEKR